MTDDEQVLDGPPPGLFFAASDDETDDVPMEEAHSLAVTIPGDSSPPSLFLPDSDDEEAPEAVNASPPAPKRKIPLPDDEEIRLPSPIPYRRGSSVRSTTVKSESPVPQAQISFKKEPPLKKRRLSSPPPSTTSPKFPPTYLGEVLVPNAWSNVSGKGYIKINEPVKLHRDVPEEPKAGPSKSNGAQGKKGDGKKQMSLKAMLKPQPSKAKKKIKGDTIVRLMNGKGTGIVEFRGTMTDCPEKLTTGVSLFVTLQVYILESAFKPPTISNVDDEPIVMFNEGQETLDEKTLRERKEAILRLFDVIGLKPEAGANVRSPHDAAKIHEEALNRLAKRKSKKVKEIVGDNEEIEVDDAEDLSKNDIDAIYKRAQDNDRTLGMMEPSETFTLKLRGYQKQALLWMHSLESGKMNARETSSMHPLWSQYVFPEKPAVIGGVIDLTADEKPFYMNSYSVGMGKTIMLAALIHTSIPSEEDMKVPPAAKSRQLKLNAAFRPAVQRKPQKPSSATLIVAPTSLLAQWSEELERSSKPGSIEVLVWHGQNRLDLEAVIEDSNDDDTCIKVVITSYGVLASEHARSEKSNSSRSPVFEIDWLRVILDEAHSCKSRTSKTAKAVYALQARRRWAVTGTPIVNKLEDLYSLFFITLPFLARDPKAIEIVQVILESVLLRREKNMRDIDGNRIVELPSKEVVVETLEFSPLERKIYDKIYISAKRDFERLDAKGLINKNYTHILAMLMRLRRAVLHPNLVLTPNDERTLSPAGDGTIDVNDLIRRFADTEEAEKGSDKSTFAEEVLAKLADTEAEECPICLDASELIEVVHRKKNPDISSSQASEPEVTLRRNDFQTSTKLQALLRNLKCLRDQDPCFRAVVFSQFTSFMDLIQVALDREKYDHYRFDGSMDINKKNVAVAEFKAPSRKPKILVISLKAGGVGLNLTTANHVFMMDCWWNAATENQAIDRVHRIGQEKTVYVTHFIAEGMGEVANTIESRILQIQKRKMAIVKEAFRGSGPRGKGTDPESIKNLKIMFGDD
ncbi:hypothetical protein C0995_015135 [Termitomyces sp. Mi166|nr:hypothetical protein C0995_015135 [Termitomyces sp. Mi166\